MAVYKLWQSRYTQAWYQLPEDEQQRLLGQVMQALDKAGGREIVICDAAWANERWPFFGLEEFPDVDAVQRHEKLLGELRWDRYMHARTSLGTEMPMPG